MPALLFFACASRSRALAHRMRGADPVVSERRSHLDRRNPQRTEDERRNAMIP